MKYSCELLLVVSVTVASACGKKEKSITDQVKENTGRMDIPEIEIPEDNPQTPNGIALGNRLFFDPILSKDNTIACASCHDPNEGLSDPRLFSEGVDKKLGTRQSMGLTNTGFGSKFFWDGRADSLEEQALGPVENPLEMAETWENVIIKLQAHGEYPDLFSEAFSGSTEITKELVAKAIAQYERTFVSFNSKFDQFVAEKIELSKQEHYGYQLFFSESADCFHCHGNILFTDNRFHNNGLDKISEDEGLFLVTEDPADKLRFKTPTLRNIELTAPYMHDGRFKTLEEVVRHYDTHIRRSATLDPLMRNGIPLELSENQVAAVVAFLKTLTDIEFVEKVQETAFDLPDSD